MKKIHLIHRNRAEKKVLFLDFDGVLTSDANTLRCRLEHKPKNPYGLDWFDPECLSALQRIVDRTGALIVVSSAWRELGCEFLLRLWDELDMPGELYGTTPVWVLTKREAIEQWLKDNEWDRYVILDDADLGREHSYRTDKATGLTSADADRIIEMLNLKY